MGLMGDYKNKLLDAAFGTGDPVTVYLGISNTPADWDGTNFTEPTATEYARLAITNNRTNFPVAVAGIMSNGVDFDFPMTEEAWGTIYDFAFFVSAGCAPTPANMLGIGSLITPKVLAIGAHPTFSAGDLKILCDPSVV